MFYSEKSLVALEASFTENRKAVVRPDSPVMPCRILSSPSVLSCQCFQILHLPIPLDGNILIAPSNRYLDATYENPMAFGQCALFSMAKERKCFAVVRSEAHTDHDARSVWASRGHSTRESASCGSSMDSNARCLSSQDIKSSACTVFEGFLPVVDSIEITARLQ